MKYTVIILAGGKGKRIKKFTTKKPKPLVEIFNKPFIEYQIDLIKKQKYKKIIISVGHYGNQIINFLKKKKFKDLNITFSKDGQKALGTGGALKKIFKNNKGNFIILYGDSYLPIDLEKVQTKFIHSKKDALLTIYKNQNRFDKSNIKIKNRKILYDKHNPDKSMNYIDYGLSVLKSNVIQNYCKKKKFDLSDVFMKLCLDQKIAYYIVKKRFYEIGSYKGINDFKNYIINKKNVR
jgi:NDP-sugar pyrophosphorylase family protein